MNLETVDCLLTDAGHVDVESGGTSPLACRVERLACAGIDDRSIAAALGSDIVTVRFWRTLQADALALVDVVPLLYRHALGFEREVQRRGRTVVEHVPPNTRACIFWLRNGRPDQWNDRPDRSGIG